MTGDRWVCRAYLVGDLVGALVCVPNVTQIPLDIGIESVRILSVWNNPPMRESR